MSESIEQPKSICARCKYLMPETTSYLIWTQYTFRCGKNLISQNPITGDCLYGLCATKNSNGQCEDFEAPKMFLTKVCEKLEQMIRRKTKK